MNINALPYAGTSGWSGSDTSQDRARSADSSGITGHRQTALMEELHDAGTDGLTWKEFSDLTGWHHGTCSGALSVLHKSGHICRLDLRRGGCLVYVLPENVMGRDTGEQGRRAGDSSRPICLHCGAEQ